MNGTMRSTRVLQAAAAGLLLATTTTACTTRDRAGGEADEDVTVLTFAQPNDGEPPQPLMIWAEQVNAASEGSLEIQFENGWRLGEATYETATIEDVRGGEVDMSWVGARAFDRAGISSFQALLAPMLVDSHALQRAVFEEGIPEEMLAGVDGDGIVGISVLPGPMRKVLGVEKPFLTPADFAGTTVGMQDSGVAQRTFEAWGSSAKAMASGTRDLSEVDAYEQQLQSIWGNQYQADAAFLTADLNLWPRPLVLFVSEEVHDGLSEDQRAALTEAGEASIMPALSASADEDTAYVEDVCSSGLQIESLSSQQRASLLEAAEPVYEQLRQDAHTAGWLDRIAELKADLGVEADGMDCSGAGSAAPASGPLPNGTYRQTLTVADVTAGCRPGDPGAEPLLDREQVDRTLEFEVTGDEIVQIEYPAGQPELREPGWQGTYRTFRDTFELDEGGPFEPLSMTWTFDGEQLVLSDMRTEFCDARTVWTSNPWRLVDAEAGAGIEGSWTTRLTEADWAPEDGPAGVFTMAFSDGRVTVTDPSGDIGFYGDYTPFRNRLTVTGGPDDLQASYTVVGDELVIRDVTIPGCTDCRPYEVVWESHPWTRQ